MTRVRSLFGYKEAVFGLLFVYGYLALLGNWTCWFIFGALAAIFVRSA